ncbi:uncharacterized protein LOC111712856 [Eurytemora carolleeae]|uniref:uncharacterized protein LOC111712856 n=1 Tax=Eurytemora carolleeae TaxID=1294199 RepID=UPI000C78A76F|nr:uncharacterized protein LOC111712856 [Eurytemora carolleeae]|eukprot:XP_023343370.1 uncharacterized protein LOC111712856 [Eurytemora affinis]
MLTMPDVVYTYGFNLGYGFGFGGPYLLPTYLADTAFTCTPVKFLNVLNKYGFSSGLNSQVKIDQIQNFGVDCKQALHCLLQHSGGYSEAAEVEYLLEDLQEAAAQYIALINP